MRICNTDLTKEIQWQATKSVPKVRKLSYKENKSYGLDYAERVKEMGRHHKFIDNIGIDQFLEQEVLTTGYNKKQGKKKTRCEEIYSNGVVDEWNKLCEDVNAV